MGYTLPSDAAVLEAARETHWTEYTSDKGTVRTVVRYGSKGKEMVTIGCPREGGQVFVYVPNGIVRAGVKVEGFTPLPLVVPDPHASYRDYSAVMVEYMD